MRFLSKAWVLSVLLVASTMACTNESVIGESEPIPGPDGRVPEAISTSGELVCVRRADGTAHCGGESDAEPPQLGALAGVAGLHGDGSITCARLLDGRVACWGSVADRRTSVPKIIDGFSRTAQVVADLSRVCALGVYGDVGCWQSISASVVDVGVKSIGKFPGARQIAIGSSHACVLTSEGAVLCAGGNDYGQLGDGTQESRPYTSWRPVNGVSDAVFIAAAIDTTCAIRKNKSVTCWGRDSSGSLGVSETVALPVAAPTNPIRFSAQPIDLTGIDGVEQLAMGAFRTCARRADGTLLCWGKGLGKPGDRVQPALSDVADVTIDAVRVCALANGEAYCFAQTEKPVKVLPAE